MSRTETQIAVDEIDEGTTPIAVRRGLGARVKDFLTVDPEAAGVIRTHQAQRAEDLAHGGVDSLPEGAVVTAVMEERAQAIRDVPERH